MNDTSAALPPSADEAGDGGESAAGSPTPVGGSVATLFADDAPGASGLGADGGSGEKKSEVPEAEDLSDLVQALREGGGEGDEGGGGEDKGVDRGDGESESPLPPYVRGRTSVREDTVIAVDIAKKVKVKDAPTAANTYAAKKTVAQGMMDIALITSNANQLRYLFEFAKSSDFFHLNVALIIISLILQIAVGVTLIFKGRADLRGEHKMAHANRLNNYVVVGVFLVTIINVFLAAFSVSNDNKDLEKIILASQPSSATAAITAS